MKKRSLSTIVGAFCIVSTVAIAGPTLPTPAPPTQVQIQAQAQDPGSVGLIDKMNGYYLQYVLANTIQNMEQDFDDRIRWEVHAGVGFMYNSAPNGFYPVCPPNSMANLGIKLNLMNPKMVRPKDLLAEIRYLRTLLSVQRANSTDDLLAECDKMEKGTNAYLDEFWWKRLSVGLSFPITSTNSYYSLISGSNAFVFLGYDLGDLVTLQAGYSTQNKFMVAVSTDISTPTYVFVTNFYNSLSRFTGVPAVVGTAGPF